MSPKRGDRVTVPPPDGEWDIRFGSSDAVKGREELCRHALANTRRCFEDCAPIHAHGLITSVNIAYVATSRLIATVARTWSNGNSRSPAAGVFAMPSMTPPGLSGSSMHHPVTRRTPRSETKGWNPIR